MITSTLSPTLNVLQGSAILPYVHDVAAFRIQYFREFPYLYQGKLAYEEESMWVKSFNDAGQ